MKSILLLGVSVSLAACVTHDGIMSDLNRDNLNDEIETCAKTRGVNCKELGDDYGGFSQRSRQSDWQQPHDLALAKRAYLLGCESGEGLACRALIEHRLFANEEEERRFHTLSSYYGQEVRSPAELAAEEEKDREALEKKEKELAKIRKEEREKQDRTLEHLNTAVQDLSNQLNSGGQGAGAPGDGKGAKKDPCAPCKDFGPKLTRACQGDKAQSWDCYTAAAQMHECVGDTVRAPGCAKDPAWEKREAARMRRAAKEMAR